MDYERSTISNTCDNSMDYDRSGHRTDQSAKLKYWTGIASNGNYDCKMDTQCTSLR